MKHPSLTKIVHFGKYYPPDTGGIENVTQTLAKGAQATEAYDVSVVCFAKNKSSFTQDNSITIHRYIPFITIASQPLSFRYAWRCVRELFANKIIHVHAPNILAAIIASLAPPSKKVITHWHSDISQKGFLGLLMRPVECMLAFRSTAIITTTKTYADNSPIVKHFTRKVTVIPIGIPDYAIVYKNASATNNALLKQLGDKKIILAVGRLVKFKGFDVLVRAAKHIPDDALVVIVGDGPEHNNLEQLSRKLGVSKKIIFTGALGPLQSNPTNNDESAIKLHTLFSKAHMLSLPSTDRAESFGIVMLEAMAYGLPVVASDIKDSGITWVNKHEQTGYNVPPNNPSSLAKHINTLLTNEGLRQSLSKNSRARYEKYFTESVSIQKVTRLYSKLLQ